MARPNKEIDKKIFENLCGLQCTKLEICDALDVTDKTLERWCRRTYKMGFSEVFAIKRGKGKVSLRRMQWKLAEKNAAMAIFLGKQYLGQTDKPIPEVEEMEDDGLLQALADVEADVDDSDFLPKEEGES